MNVYDSQKIVDLLRPLGYELTDEYAIADLAILNTCNIREKATEKVYSDLGRIQDVFENRQDKPMIAVTGCVAQAEGDEILKRVSYVDFVLGPQTLHELPEIITRFERNRSEQGKKSKEIHLNFEPDKKFDNLPDVSEIDNPSQFLTIQEGCDKFCHFCCVPYTRGAEYSRPAQDIIKEARNLVARGAKEITLLGQNVNAYHGEGLHKQVWGLGRLLKELANIEGLSRLRYTTSHPNDVDDELIEAHRDIPSLMPFLHLPVQSGSDKILKAMNRKHKVEFYVNLVENFLKARSDMAFSSDFIVGYPGETEQDFADTLALVEHVNFAQAFSFKYSKRPGTPAAVLQDDTSEVIKDQRLKILQDLLHKQQIAYNQTFVGKVVDVLVEKPARDREQMLGRTPYWQNVLIPENQNLIGKIIPVTITESTLKSLKGHIS